MDYAPRRRRIGAPVERANSGLVLDSQASPSEAMFRKPPRGATFGVDWRFVEPVVNLSGCSLAPESLDFQALRSDIVFS